LLNKGSGNERHPLLTKERLNRRELICAAISSAVTFSGSSIFGAATGLATEGAGRSWRLAQGIRPQAEEEEALRTGLSFGMTLIDTAESYGSEELIGRAIAGQRDRVFLVSKVSANHVRGNGIARACEASLTRLGTDYLDLYLLHWPNGITITPAL
jgi:aryl-alcohol dehydrogenase-like predicted oxidoreductase